MDLSKKAFCFWEDWWKILWWEISRIAFLIKNISAHFTGLKWIWTTVSDQTDEYINNDKKTKFQTTLGELLKGKNNLEFMENFVGTFWVFVFEF